MAAELPGLRLKLRVRCLQKNFRSQLRCYTASASREGQKFSATSSTFGLFIFNYYICSRYDASKTSKEALTWPQGTSHHIKSQMPASIKHVLRRKRGRCSAEKFAYWPYSADTSSKKQSAQPNNYGDANRACDQPRSKIHIFYMRAGRSSCCYHRSVHTLREVKPARGMPLTHEEKSIPFST